MFFTTDGYNGDNNNFLALPVNRTSETEYKLQGLDHGSWINLATGLKFGETYNIRIEYEITSIGTTSATAASSTATGNVSVYVNGELKTTFAASGQYENKSNSSCYIGFLDRGYKGTGTHTVYFDNTYIATED